MPNNSSKALLLVLIVVVLVWLLIGRNESEPPVPETAANATERLAAIYAADQIEDPVERCRAYPTPSIMPQKHVFYDLYCDEAEIHREHAQIKALLNVGDFAQVDQLIESYQAEYLATGKREYRVYGALRFFYDASPWSDETSLAWLEAAPESPGAHSARADFLLAKAYSVNGGWPLSRLSDEERELWHALGDEANDLLVKSYELNPGSLLAIRGRLAAGKFVSTEKIEAVFNQGIAIDEDSYALRHIYLRKYPTVDMESRERAERMREQVFEDLVDDPRLPSLEVDDYISEGRYLWRNNEFEALHALANESLTITPTLDILRFSISALPDIDTLTELELLSKASSYGRRSPETDRDRAVILNEMGEYQWAADILEKSIQRHPGYFWSYHDLAKSYRELGRFEDAVKMLQTRLNYKPREVSTLSSIAWLYINRLGQPEKAIPYVDQYLAIEPENGWAWALRIDTLRPAGGEPFYEALEQYLRYVDRSNLSYREAILDAEATLAERDRQLEAAAD